MNQQLNKFVFTVGPPGSGKSTAFPNAFEADKFPSLYSRSGHINKSLLQSAHNKCLEDCIKDMTNGTELVVQSNTNLNSKNLISYLEACVKYGYEVICILPINDLLHFQSEHLKTRSRQIQHLIETRSSGVRVIPEDVIYRMINEFDSIKFFYQKLVDERDPIKWIESINNPFFETVNYPVSIVDITNETIDKIKTNDDVTFYTPIMESLELITDSEDSNQKFRSNTLVQLANRKLAFLTLTSGDNKGFIILWNDGHNLKKIDRFIRSQF